MDLDAVAAELYAASPDDFVQLRTARAGEAKSAGDRPLAKQIGQLRRPTRSAWLVNLLAHESSSELEALLDLGESMRDAQSRLDAAELRRLSAERRRVVDALSRAAHRLGSAHGYEATDAVAQEVTQTLQAALADPDLSEQVRLGRVTSAIPYGGFGPFALTEAPSPPANKATAKRAPAAHSAEASDEAESGEDADDPALTAAEKAAAAAHEAFERAQNAAAEATAEAELATSQADDAADDVERLRAELTTAEAAERAARDTARTARRRMAELTNAAATAEKASARAAAAVQDLRGGS